MREDFPNVQNIHCIAHRLALVTSQAAEKIPYMLKFQEIISGLYYYFKHSTLHVAKLKEMEKVLHAPQLKMKEVHSVRWFSFYAALEALYRCWEPLAVMLEQQEEPKGKGILKNIASFKFLGVMSMLMDVIPVLTQLNLVFQKTDLDLAVVNPALEATKDQLRHLLTHDDSATQRRKVNTVKVDLVTNMLEQLEKRFPKEATDIVSAFSALALPHIPEELESYGNEKVEFLVETYGSFVSAQETRAEWLCLKRLVVTEKYPCGKIGRLYNIIADHHPSSFPNILKLAGIAMALPVHTADVERGFSAQNSLKTTLRNRLGAKRLNTLLTLRLEGPHWSAFPYGRAMELFRRVEQMHFFMN
ncbi:hypothetical protein SKAU_G00194700 [Synaphobranchus kaupii]|uniref:HAT C-terminal dimerisation domain-containing protein n=1 Tax=Synaphobranchus kaupii TaxID=118154 RepID=A0A9Q1FED4_SYNKA|nr:hypothetical protein SKAU_G00194700 [Synaphobranchus kaupii]